MSRTFNRAALVPGVVDGRIAYTLPDRSYFIYPGPTGYSIDPPIHAYTQEQIERLFDVILYPEDSEPSPEHHSLSEPPPSWEDELSERGGIDDE